MLIGPNGSGKSAFIDIIDAIQHAFVDDYVFAQDLYDQGDKKYFRNVISHYETQLEHPIKKHFSYEDKPSQIDVRMRLTDYDYENLRFLLSHANAFCELVSKYSMLSCEMTQLTIDDLLLASSTFSYRMLLDQKT